MKYIASIIALTFSFFLNAQTRSVREFEEMPEYGIYLTEGWRYAPADDPAFAAPGYDDKSWDSISPAAMVYQIPELRGVATGWMRLRFRVSPEIAESTPLLNVWQNCATEVYLDGKSVHRFGKLGVGNQETVPLGMNQPAVALKLEPGREHVLAIRFSVWEGAEYIRNHGAFMRMNIISLRDYQAEQKINTASNEAYFVLVSVFFLISLLHLSFYRYDRAQRANLFFSLYTISSTIAFALVNMQSYVQDASQYKYVFEPSFFAALMGSIWTVKALGSLFGFRVSRIVATMWMVYPLALFGIWYNLNLYFYTASILFQLVNIILAMKAFRQGKRGAGIITAGFMVSLLMLVLTVLYLYDFIAYGLIVFQSVIALTYLAPAFGISIYLAREFALNSGLLREKLAQVEALSAKNLQQEQEKQALLSHQNEMLEQQVAERTSELTQSLANLKQAQNQLIQSEKMASLGELTAGIAHEIQNPLNFVNNFSDVSMELLDEMGEELDKGDTEEAKAIAQDIKQNLEKIVHHGRRADGIVKGMLQHSRASSGQKEVTDLNALADEYLRLAYHGLRAKDKSFNAELITEFDENLPNVNAIPQDFGRVLLNLFTNAFYATQQKKSQSQFSGDNYKPTVIVITKQSGNVVEIAVKDNGTGIPDAIKDKILQPFFTTKPTGEGTGLGLSLSYDIVVKGHGGAIAINSKEGEGSEFTISLPFA